MSDFFGPGNKITYPKIDLTDAKPIKCALCPNIVNDPHEYSICFDPCAEGNIWGGDSHEILAYLCTNCGTRIAKEAQE